MGFYTTLKFCRPGTPPGITADDLGTFIANLAATSAVKDGSQLLNVRFGRSVDQDEEPTSRSVEVAPRMYTCHDIDWDINETRLPGIDSMCQRLKGDTRRIYRAFAVLGNATDEILQPITRVNSPENTIDYTPYDLSIEVGPVVACALSSESPAGVGWIALGLSGDGYLYPWTLSEIVCRAEASPAIVRLSDVCRTMWPVEPQRPGPEVVRARQQRRDIWPYDDCDRSADWFWSVHET